MIITDEKILRMKCNDALPEEVGPIVEQLERELEHSERIGRAGIGLAAPQINIHKNIAIVRINDIYKVNLVNCKIINQYDKIIFKNEGCLSFANRLEDTMRYQEVHVANNLVYPNSFIATGLFGVCIQHELDHLSGILLPDIALPKPKQKVRPNDICPCGKINKLTGRSLKYKKCCGK